jgi:outer membrane receptor protein involved in Fe transport
MIEVPLLLGLRGMAGARVESSRQEIRVASPFAASSGDAPPGAERTDLDVLPAASLVAALSDEMNLRVAYGGTVARPLVRELAPFLTQDFVRRRNVQGNSDLDRTFIHNFDLRWELFPSPTEVFALSLFYKRFQSPIETVIANQNGDVRFENIDGAVNYGAELEARVGLGVLDESLESFSAFSNVALIQSEVALADEQVGAATSQKRPLAGQSPFVANLAFGYEPAEGPFSAFVFYNVFGRRIQEVGRLGLPDVYEEPFHSLDLTAFYKMSGGLSTSLSVGNLLLQEQSISQGGLNFSSSQRGASVSAKLSWSP